MNPSRPSSRGRSPRPVHGRHRAGGPGRLPAAAAGRPCRRSIIPTIQVQTLCTWAPARGDGATVTAPLERQLGQDVRPGADEFGQHGRGLGDHPAVRPGRDPGRRRTARCRRHQRSSSLLPADLPHPPVYAKVNPADAPVLTLAITSDTLPLTEVQNLVEHRAWPRRSSQVSGRGPGLALGRPAARHADPGRHPGRCPATA
ncbi:hypothetical protein ACRAWD_21390 [Caulobacter segnis]